MDTVAQGYAERLLQILEEIRQELGNIGKELHDANGHTYNRSYDA